MSNIAKSDSESKQRRFSPIRKLKICHVIATVEGGLWCFEQLRDLRDRYGHDVTVILSGNEGSLPGMFRAAGIRVLVADFNMAGTHGKGFVRTWPAKVKNLSDIFLRERFDVVQTHLINTMLFGRTAAWLADVPVRLSMIAGPFHLMGYTTAWLDGWTAWMETGIIPSCQLSYDLCRAMGVPDRKLSLIYYGPDETRFDPQRARPAGLRAQMGWSPDTPIIALVAYFYPRMASTLWIPPTVKGKAFKGHEDLIQAVPLIVKEFPNAKFILAGNGWGAAGEQYMDEMRQLVARLKLQDKVFFLGKRDDIPDIYMDTTVAVQASLNENLGGSIEALLMQRPTVVTRVGGLIDTVHDGQTGVVVLPENPASLAEGILRLLRDPEFAARVGRQARAYMLEKFTLTTTVDELAGLYERQSCATRGHYRSNLRVARFALGGAVFAVLSARYILIDKILLTRLPALFHSYKYRLKRIARGLAGTHA